MTGLIPSALPAGCGIQGKNEPAPRWSGFNYRYPRHFVYKVADIVVAGFFEFLFLHHNSIISQILAMGLYACGGVNRSLPCIINVVGRGQGNPHATSDKRFWFFSRGLLSGLYTVISYSYIDT